jgi:lysyl-tRNA synthetase class II
MATLKELRDEHLRKLTELRAMGDLTRILPVRIERTNGGLVNDFDTLEGQTVTVTGRIVSIRKFGKIAFIALKMHREVTIILAHVVLPVER